MGNTENLARFEAVLLDPLAVDPGAIATSEVFDENRISQRSYASMPSAHRQAIYADIVVGFTADEELPVGKIDAHEFAAVMDHP
jgi:hypothetical protein